MPADVLVGKLNKDASFAHHRGTLGQVSTQALEQALGGCALPRARRPCAEESSPLRTVSPTVSSLASLSQVES